MLHSKTFPLLFMQYMGTISWRSDLLQDRGVSGAWSQTRRVGGYSASRGLLWVSFIPLQSPSSKLEFLLMIHGTVERILSR